MENINPTLELTFCLQQAVMSGQGLKSGISAYLQKSKTDDILAAAAVQLLSVCQAGGSLVFDQQLSPYQIAVLNLLRRGLNGESIGVHLNELRNETEIALHREIERHVCLVPFWSFLPLVLFQLPALLLVAIFPLLRDFLAQLSSS